MIISPPFLPQSGLTGDAADTDTMMTAVEAFEPGYHGVYPVAFDRRWHCGVHLIPDTLNEPVRAIADGEVVAYRVSQNPISDGHTDDNGQEVQNTNTGFVLLRHVTDTGDGRTITFYSLYMNLLDLTAQKQLYTPPANPPQNTSPTGLAAWLLEAGDAVKPGNGKKVYRKDMLGLWGQSQGLRHLHFEVFMTEEDFTAWFEQSGHTVQLGEKNPVQPTSKDWWGHAYYVIPGSVEFLDSPTGVTDTAHFPALSRGKLPNNSSKLYVEVYFHKGQRLMRAWLDENGDGNCVLLTPNPVKDKSDDYEYNLYARAMKLYPACPSDGYEMLRFGRILADSPTLTVQNNATWIAVPFDASGAQGYVDISKTSVVKLSDADFPFFTGWKKIDNENAPLDANGLFSYYKLRQLVGDATATAYEIPQGDPQFSLDNQLTYYVQRNDSVRDGLSGFVCHTQSEWDPANNDQRYQDLNLPDGYFGKCKDTDPDGYERFIGFVKKLQFMDDVPSLAGGKKFWFFHPLAFIRHFRRCGWMNSRELAQCIPRKIIDETKDSSHHKIFPTGAIPWAKALHRAQTFASHLNPTLRKYGISHSALRMSFFLGNAIQETIYLSATAEVGGAHTSYAPWYGRGVIQLTFEPNYAKYGAYRGWRAAAATFRDQLEVDLDVACDSAGFYWVTCAKEVHAAHSINIEADVFPVLTRATLGNVCNSYDYHTKSCRSSPQTIDFLESVQFEKSARAVNTGNPNSTGPMNGLVPRTNVFLSALAKLTDFIVDYESAYAQKE